MSRAQKINFDEDYPWISRRPSLPQIEKAVEKVLSGKVKSSLNGFYGNEVQWDPLHDLFASPIITEERNLEDKLISYHISAYAYGLNFEVDDLEIRFSGNKRDDLISLLKALYLYEEFPQEEPSPEPSPEPDPDPFHPEIRECINRFSEAKTSSDLYSAMKDLSFLLHEDNQGRLE